jgi:hypothetical protein
VAACNARSSDGRNLMLMPAEAGEEERKSTEMDKRERREREEPKSGDVCLHRCVSIKVIYIFL